MDFDRQAKRHLLAGAHTAWAYAGPGIAESLHQELEELLPRLKTQTDHRSRIRRRRDGAVITNIEYRQLLELVVRLTTAQDVSLEIASGSVPSPAALDQLFGRIRWRIFFQPGETVALRVDSRGSVVYHEGLIRERMDGAMRSAGLVPAMASEKEASSRLTVRIERDRGRVELSLGGAPLWQRGYRALLSATAPLREDLAQAALRRAAPWLTAGESPTPDMLFVPFCGTGTFLFEYLIAKLAIPPFVFRSGYAFSAFACGTPDSVGWARRILLRELVARIDAVRPVHALLVDSSPEVVRVGKENLGRFLSLIGAALAPAAGESETGGAGLGAGRARGIAAAGLGAARAGGAAEGSAAAEAAATAGTPGARRRSEAGAPRPRMLPPGEERSEAAARGRSIPAPRAHVAWVVDDALSRPWAARIPGDARSVFIPLNPPYGKRLAVGSTVELYGRIGGRCEELARELGRRNTLSSASRQRGRPHGEVPSLSGLILCPTEEAWSSFSASCPSLHKETHHFTQGGIDIRLCLFTSTEEREMMNGQ